MERKYPYHQLVDTGSTKITFNCPPELQKALINEAEDKRNLGRKQADNMPQVYVVADTVLHEETPLFNPEFPILYATFVAGGFNWAQFKLDRKIYLVGAKDDVDRHYNAIRLALEGPTNAELGGKEIGLKKGKIRDQLITECSSFKIVSAEQLIEKVYFKSTSVDSPEVARIDDLDLVITHTGKDAYEVHQNGRSTIVELTSEGDLSPTWSIPVLPSVEQPFAFRAVTLGSDNGFGRRMTTSYMIELDGSKYLWDCPAGTSHVLRANGVEPGDIEGIFISHIHDDHALDLLPFALNGRRKITIYATSEVIYSLKRKLSALWKMRIARLSHFFIWRPVNVNVPEFIGNYCLKFHYCVHPIPAVGVTISDNRKNQLLTIVGDTALGKYLDPKVEQGKVTAERRDQIMALLTHKGLVYVDVGDAAIHGTISDIINCDPTRVFMQHTNDLELYQSGYAGPFKLLNPGTSHGEIPMDRALSDATVVSEILHDISIYDAPKWSMSLMLQTKDTDLKCEAGQTIVREGSTEIDYVYFVMHGSVNVVVNENVVATLSKGEFFGEQAALAKKKDKARNASIVAATPVYLKRIPAKLFDEMVTRDHERAQAMGRELYSAQSYLKRVWQNRQYLSNVPGLKLSSRLTNRVAQGLKKLTVGAGETILYKGTVNEAPKAYIIAKGSVKIILEGGNVITLGENEMFGENVALGVSNTRTADVVAGAGCILYQISGFELNRLYDEMPGTRVELQNLMMNRKLDEDTLAQRDEKRFGKDESQAA